MGANSEEFNKSKNIRNSVDESKLGSLYSSKLNKLALPGVFGSAGGMMGYSSMSEKSAKLKETGNITESNDYADYANYALGAGSALGALAAPLMFRSSTKQSVNDAQDTKERLKNLKSGQRQTAAQRADTVLNAGESIKKLGTGAVAAGTGANLIGATTGTGATMSATGMMELNKVASTATIPGVASNSILGWNNTFGGTFGWKEGGIDYSSIGGIGMAFPLMMALNMVGGKITKGIKSLANKGAGSKFKYNNPGAFTPNSDRDLEKWNTLGTTFGTQVNLLAMTDKLSPYENLALTALSAIAKNTSASPALFDLLSGKESSDKYSTKNSHNKMADLLGQKTTFSASANYKKEAKTGAIHRITDFYNDTMEGFDDFILKNSKRIQAGSAAFNPLNILFGGLFGPSAEKQISSIFGLDEDSIEENARDRVAKTLNLPHQMVQIAETPGDKILKMAGENIESKKIAILQGIYEVNRNQLLLNLEDHTQDRGGFIGRVEEQKDALDNKTGIDGALRKLRGIAGNVPGIGLIANMFALAEAKDRAREIAATQLAQDLEYQSRNNSNERDTRVLMSSFLGREFPTLFLDSLSMDEERNILLQEIRDNIEECCELPAEGRDLYNNIQRRHTGSAWDLTSGQIISEEQSREAMKEALKEEMAEIIEFYKEAEKKHKGSKSEIRAKRDEELEKVRNRDGENSLQAARELEEERRRNKLTVKTMTEILKILKNTGKGGVVTAEAIKNTGKKVKETAGNIADKLKGFFKGGVGGALWGATKLTTMALGGLLQAAIGSGKRIMIGGLALAYLGYRIHKTELGGELGTWSKNAMTTIAGYLPSDFTLEDAKDIGNATLKIGTAAYIGAVFKDLYFMVPERMKKLKAAIGILGIVAMGGTIFSDSLGIKEGDTFKDILFRLPVVGSLMKSFGYGEDGMIADDNDKLSYTIAGILETFGAGLLMAPHPLAKAAGAVILLGAKLATSSGRSQIKYYLLKAQDSVMNLIIDSINNNKTLKGAFKIAGIELERTNSARSFIQSNLAEYQEEVKERQKSKKIKVDPKTGGINSKQFIEDNISNRKVRDRLLELHARYDRDDDGVIEKDEKSDKYQAELLKALKGLNDSQVTAAQNALSNGKDVTNGTITMIAELRRIAATLDKNGGQNFNKLSFVDRKGNVVQGKYYNGIYRETP